MDIEGQTNMNDGSNRSLNNNNIWPKSARKNFVPLLCITFLIIFTQYEILSKWQNNTNGEDVSESTGANKYKQLIHLSKLLTGIALPLKQNITNNSTVPLNL